MGDLRPEHWPEVARIYAAGIATGFATFETDVPSWEAWDVSHLKQHRLVALSSDAVLGWVATSGISDRCAYAGVVEHSVYVAPEAQGQGVGRLLLEGLIASTEAAGVWTIQSGIFPENVGSLALHERCGFRQIGVRERIGRLRGEWRDVVAVERRSATIS